MSTLRVDNIKSRTGSVVTIPETNTLAVTGIVSVTSTGSITNAGNLTNSGTLTNSGNVNITGGITTVGGAATISGNVFISGITTISGNLVNTGTFTHSGTFSPTDINAPGIITAIGGFNIGIQSGGLNVTTGVVTSINFVGSGNSISYNSGTKTVNVSISGGGGGTILELGTGRTGAATGDSGIIIERGTDINAFIGYDESADQAVFKYTTATGSSTGDLTFSSDVPVGIGTLTAERLNTKELVERANITNTVLTGTISLDLDTNTTHYFTANASANWTFNFRGTSSLSLNNLLSVGDAITCTVLSTQGATAYYNNGWQIDGSAVTPKWLGGYGAPNTGHANSVDYYSFTIFKTANATFTVFANQSIYS